MEDRCPKIPKKRACKYLYTTDCGKKRCTKDKMGKGHLTKDIRLGYIKGGKKKYGSFVTVEV